MVTSSGCRDFWYRLGRQARVHFYSTRSSTFEHFYTKQSAPNIQTGKAFTRVGVKIWNEIPTNLKSGPKNSFKKLFKILESEDSYVEVDALINKM